MSSPGMQAMNAFFNHLNKHPGRGWPLGCTTLTTVGTLENPPSLSSTWGPETL